MSYEPSEIGKVLSIYPTREGFSFSFFENQNLLVKVGNQVDGKTKFYQQIQELIDKYDPEIIITEDHDYPGFKRSRKIASKLRSISRIAEKNKLAIRCYTRLMVQGVFSCFEVSNKHQMAIYLADQFPQLQELLPPEPKFWRKEHYRIRLFDSIGFGYAYYHVEGNLNDN